MPSRAVTDRVLGYRDHAADRHPSRAPAAAQPNGAVRDHAWRGYGSPDGRRYHVGHAIDGGGEVIAICDSPDKLERFAGEVLVPILLETGVDPVDPRVLAIHNVVAG
jgi:hypothetical protein